MIYDTYNYVYVNLLEKGYTRIKVKLLTITKYLKIHPFLEKESGIHYLISMNIMIMEKCLLFKNYQAF